MEKTTRLKNRQRIQLAFHRTALFIQAKIGYIMNVLQYGKSSIIVQPYHGILYSHQRVSWKYSN